MMDSSIGAESREATCHQGGSPPVVRCAFCGEPEVLEIADIWTDSNFLLDTCCPALLESVSAEMDNDPAWGRELLRWLGAEELTGHRLRRVSDGAGCHPMLDWQLVLRLIRFAEARAFIARHHVQCPPPVAWRFGSSIWTGRQMLGVATVGNPVARALMGRGIVEVNRLCIRRDVALLLCWNAASMLYGEAARTAERAGFSRIVTYTREERTARVCALRVGKMMVPPEVTAGTAARVRAATTTPSCPSAGGPARCARSRRRVSCFRRRPPRRHCGSAILSATARAHCERGSSGTVEGKGDERN